jgi:Cu2+-exporting ATPase
LPFAAGPGTAVYAGTVNLGEPIRVRVTAAADDTAISDIARLMDHAGQSRSRFVRIADRVARLYAPVVHSLALASLVGWLLTGAGLHQALLVAISVLIITCPCALGLAVPAAHVVAAGALVRRGVLIKDGSALERLAEADYVVFDKTGTLTLGEPRAANLETLSARQQAIALALAQASRHPLSRGLAAALRSRGVMAAPVEQLSETAGHGVQGRYFGEDVALVRSTIASGEQLTADLVIGRSRSTLRFSDPLRPDVGETLAALGALGIDAMIISGDAAAPVAGVAEQFTLPFVAAASPAEKLSHLHHLAGEGRKVLMAGDGLNDGPALATAHVSLAPASASDVSRQAADAVFLGAGLMPVATAVRAARRTMGIVRQNFRLAAGYNLIAVPLAVAGLVTPLIAAVAMSLSSLIVIGNSLRLSSAAR